MRIKTYQSQGNITGQGSQAYSLGGEKTNPLSIPKTDQLVWQAVGQVGDALTDIDKRMQEARRVDEITNAKVRIGDEFSKLDEYMQSDEFLANTKYQDYDKYREEQTEGIKERVYGDVKDRRTIDAVNSMWAEANLRNKTRVKGQARQMQVEEGRADTHSNLTKLQATFLRAGNNNNRNDANEAIETAESLVNSKVAVGYFTKDEGRRLLKEFRTNTTLTMWKQNIEQDPKWVMEQLDKPGVSNLSEDNRLILKKAAKTAYESKKSDVHMTKKFDSYIEKYNGDYRKMATEVMKDKSLEVGERKKLNGVFNSMHNNQEADKKAIELKITREKNAAKEQAIVDKNNISNDLFKLEYNFPARLDYIKNISPKYGDLKRTELALYEKDIKEVEKKRKADKVEEEKGYNDAEKELIDKITFTPGSVDSTEVRATGQNSENREKLAKKLANAKKKGEVQKNTEDRLKAYHTDIIENTGFLWWGKSPEDIKKLEDVYYKQLDTLREYFDDNPKATAQEAQKAYNELIRPELAKKAIDLAVNRTVPKAPVKTMPATKTIKDITKDMGLSNAELKQLETAFKDNPNVKINIRSINFALDQIRKD